MLVASGQGLMAVINPNTKAESHGSVLLSSRLVKNSML
jgi:hypothetical protein